MSDVKRDGLMRGFPLGRSIPGTDRAALAACWAILAGFHVGGAIWNGGSGWFWFHAIFATFAAGASAYNVKTVNQPD